MREQKKQQGKLTKPPPNTRPEKAVSLRPLDFDEALAGILQVPPAPKGEDDWRKVVSPRKKK